MPKVKKYLAVALWYYLIPLSLLQAVGLGYWPTSGAYLTAMFIVEGLEVLCLLALVPSQIHHNRTVKHATSPLS
jgi:hypothetical protein